MPWKMMLQLDFVFLALLHNFSVHGDHYGNSQVYDYPWATKIFDWVISYQVYIITIYFINMDFL